MHKHVITYTKLEFISFEKLPITIIDYRKILNGFADLDDYQNFVEQYNPFDDLNIYNFDNITLKLVFANFNNINKYNLQVIDAVFFDNI
ncbi:hypothetical protein [Francisella tularensis]|uniref:hypothetical protein n=1 Tax=Francisella tularensis TaxID=263 RepID=UPI00174E489A|nr:hypothetical protein [Francisella tularensis]MBD5784307.1 hypothetical protein [Francisella tularensis subsp. holarctica]